MPRDTISDEARDHAYEKRQPSRLKKYLGDLAMLACGFLLVLAALAYRLHSIWLH